MLAENGARVDLEALNRILREADVITIGFTFTPGRLLIDTRSDETDGPLVTPVEPVASVQERYLWLGKTRPTFGAPEAFSFFVWPQSMASLRAPGLLDPLFERLEAARPGAADQLRRALADFAGVEHEAALAAIRGQEPWATVWSRTGS